jgi:maltose phosphorylase
MKNYIKADPWNIIEEGFNPQLNKISESIFSLGNGRMGQRANFEEQYSGPALQGNYIGGVYYPDKTRVGWWKNGYPHKIDKVINTTSWIGIDIEIDGEVLDLAHCEVEDFKRILNMREGYLERRFTARLKNGKCIRVHALRFCSIADDEIGAIRYCLWPLNFEGTLRITVYLNGNVYNQDSNYGEKFWEPGVTEVSDEGMYLFNRTKKTGFEVCTGSNFLIRKNEKQIRIDLEDICDQDYVGQRFFVEVKKNQPLSIDKISVQLSSLNHPGGQLMQCARQSLGQAMHKGFDQLKQAQAVAWAKKWEESDILIEGDASAQQAIRFNIFQLYQTYTGKDDRLNIGPKGFTGEKYAGATFWDTEAYCLPFYLATAEKQVSRNLLLYRYKQLDKAIENATLLGFGDGAALYPMVTMDGSECHNEWEITFEEIHRNGAIAFAIYNYVRYTDDRSYLADYGLEVLIAIARFWKQRVNWSGAKQQYVMLGVTGPNEYENNVDNNWYTSKMAVWCLRYAREAAKQVSRASPGKYKDLLQRVHFKEEEFEAWAAICRNMYLPYEPSMGIFLQQDGYLDKQQRLVTDLPAQDRPLNQNWSWDRILRSCFIKQADVLQGLYYFEEEFDLETLKRNFDFYEPRTVHESSLSPCIHSILASRLKDKTRAYEFYLRTARLDLDDYNNDTEDGLHITSMAGTWMSIVEGFAGMRVINDKLNFDPLLPEGWTSFSFRVQYRECILLFKIAAAEITIENKGHKGIDLKIREKDHHIPGNKVVRLDPD